LLLNLPDAGRLDIVAGHDFIAPICDQAAIDILGAADRLFRSRSPRSGAMGAVLESHADLELLLRLLQRGIKHHAKEGDASQHHNPAHLCRLLRHFGSRCRAVERDGFRYSSALSRILSARCVNSR